MIFDSINKIEKYGFCKSVQNAFEFAKTANNLADGRYELNDGIFALVQTFYSKPIENSKIEAHQKYIDAQIIINGNERMGIAFDGTLIQDDYVQSDIAFYSAKLSFFDLTPCFFAMFFPQELHMPGLGDGSLVKKIVLKIPKALI